MAWIPPPRAAALATSRRSSRPWRCREQHHVAVLFPYSHETQNRGGHGWFPRRGHRWGTFKPAHRRSRDRTFIGLPSLGDGYLGDGYLGHGYLGDGDGVAAPGPRSLIERFAGEVAGAAADPLHGFEQFFGVGGLLQHVPRAGLPANLSPQP